MNAKGATLAQKLAQGAPKKTAKGPVLAQAALLAQITQKSPPWRF
jgi:hypothetical protein